MEAQEIKKAFEEREIKRVKVGGFDLDGVLRGKYISLDKFWSAVEKGFGFCDVIFGWDVADELYDNSRTTGWHTGYPDITTRIDLSTFRVLPSEPHTAHFLVDFYQPDGSPHPACPRNLLKKVVERAQQLGYQPKVGVEYEYWLFRETPDSLRDKGFSDITPLTPGMFGYSWVREGQQAPLLEDLLDQLNAYDVSIEGFHTETGPGVYETALKATDALQAADMAALFKTTMKILCPRHGVMVTFMAKWHASLPGSSGHIHQSLWADQGKRNAFADSADDDRLSDTARHYIGGMVRLAPELTALYAPTVNSYKRYVPGLWAPMSATWAIENRTCAIRAINMPSESSTRVELRQTAADINPYVAIATSLAAGLHGVEERMAPPPPSVGDATEAPDAARFPRSLEEATARLAESEVARQLLGEAFIDHYVRTRDWEARQYARSVSGWELQRYFEAI